MGDVLVLQGEGGRVGLGDLLLLGDLVLDEDGLLVGNVVFFDQLLPQFINISPCAFVSLANYSTAFHFDLFLTFKFLNRTANNFYGL